MVKHESIATVLDNQLNQYQNYWPEIRNVLRQIGKTKKINDECTENVETCWPNDPRIHIKVIKVGNNLKYVLVKELKDVYEYECAKDIDLNFYGEPLKDDETLLESGLLPEVLNIIDVVFKATPVKMINEIGVEIFTMVNCNE